VFLGAWSQERYKRFEEKERHRFRVPHKGKAYNIDSVVGFDHLNHN